MKLLTLFRTPSIRRSISTAFVLVTVVVVAMVIVSFFQLRQVRPFSDRIINNSSDLVDIQRLASATSALDADLERYLVIRGAEYRDNVQKDIQDMTDALALLQVNPISGTEADLSELEANITELQGKIEPLLDSSSTDTSSSELNRLTITIYNNIEQVKLLQEDLSAKTLTSLQTTAQVQGSIAGNVLTQSVILGVVVSFIAVITTILIDRRLRMISSLTDTAVAISGGDLSRVAPVESRDEIGTLAAAFNTMTSQLREFIGSLEQRVAARTKALTTSAEVSRRLTSILDPNELIAAVVNQIQSAFNYYYAQIYLFDETGENLVLTTGTGEAGAEMMKRGHRLPRGRGLVGRAAESNKSVLVSDTSQDPNWLPNELLPDTKTETAIPIAIGDRVLGVLDVQDDVTNDITSEDVTLLESLASQVAISLQNARQYAESQQFKLGIENSGDAVFATDSNGIITYTNPGFEKVYGYSPEEAVGKNPRIIKSGLLSQENYQQFWTALLAKQSVTGDIVNRHKDGHLVYIAGTNSAIVNDAGDIVGFLAVHHDITEQKKNQDLMSQRAHQQEAINTITQKIQSATTIEDAMQVAARELGHALGKRQTLVALEPSALGGEYKGKN
jgi:PAS domain S-box-containing protein